MTESLFGVAGVLAILMVVGIGLGQLSRSNFSWRWLLIAAGLLLLNDAALTNGYGLLPNLISGSDWNWQGKILAIATTLVVISLPAFGWRRTGMTLAQNSDGRGLTYGIALLLAVFFAGLAFYFPNEPFDGETLAFQMTMPGFDEELYYRGTLLLALNEAFRGRRRILGIDLGWGGIVSCFLFGLAHALGYSDGAFSFDPMTMALTALPAFLLVWFRERSGSLLLPVVLHNFANSIFLLV